jgi:DNA-binding transcriptional ArsR family regulator
MNAMARELHHPERDQIELSAVLEALSEPTRREIVLRLIEQGEAPCQAFDATAPKSNLSYHYARLREAGVTRTRLVGAVPDDLGQGRRSRPALSRPARRDHRRGAGVSAGRNRSVSAAGRWWRRSRQSGDCVCG